MNADLETQIGLAARILGMTPEKVIDEACRLFCRSVAGAKDHHGRPAKLVTPAVRDAKALAVAKRAKDSPGSIEGRIVGFVKSRGESVAPREIIAAMKGTRRDAVNRALSQLVSARVLAATGATAARRISIAAIILLMSLSAAAQAFAQQTIVDTPVGWFGMEGNEPDAGSKVDDPAKWRCTAPITEHGGGGCVFSFNMHHEFGVPVYGHGQTEMAMLRVEQAEDVRGQLGNPKAEFNFLCNDGGGGDDANMQKCLSFTYTGITRISPFILNDLRQLIAGPTGAPSRMMSPDGHYWLQLQTDGNYVIYRIDADDNGNPQPVAIFDLWSLEARLDRIDAELRALEGRR